MRDRTLAALALAALTLAALLVSCAAAPDDSGIAGLVTIGPTSPVQHEGETGEAPYSATLLIKDGSGGTVATVNSDDDGRFAVDLAPGVYLLEPQSPGVLPYAPPQEVAVEAHRYTQVKVHYDSGIR